MQKLPCQWHKGNRKEFAMKTLAKVILLSMLCVALCIISAISFAEQPKDVIVANPDSKPVPVKGNVGINGTPNVVVVNPDSQPIPVFNTNQPANELFQTQLVYDQTTGTFPTFIAPAGKRVVIQNMSWAALVPMGKMPMGYSGVTTLSGEISFLAFPIWTRLSTYASMQDRFAANLPTLFHIEPGATFSWGVADSVNESQFLPLNSLETRLTLTGYVVNLGP
jgi:hypothetical protein